MTHWVFENWPPPNFGKCFDAAALNMREFPPGAMLCHGIGVANLPGQEGRRIKHAWIELEGNAYDCVLFVKVPAAKYRADLKVSYVVQYSHSEMWRHWHRTNMPGPWDEYIVASCPDSEGGS